MIIIGISSREDSTFNVPDTYTCTRIKVRVVQRAFRVHVMAELPLGLVCV